MVTYHFKCKHCGHQIEKFRFGLENLEKWKKGKLKIVCPSCSNINVSQVLTKGSGQFKSFDW